MRPLAHHAGEHVLAPLLLLGSSGVSLLLAIGRAHLAATHAKLTRKRRSPSAAPTVTVRGDPH